MIETAIVFGLGWLIGKLANGGKSKPSPAGPLPSSPSKAPWPGDKQAIQNAASDFEKKTTGQPTKPKPEQAASALEDAMNTPKSEEWTHTPKA